MFGIDPDTLKNLANLQTQIALFMASTTAALQRIESRVKMIEDALNKEHEHA